MDKDVIGYCPVCAEKLIATKLSCNNCKLDLTGDFSLNKFSYLTKEEQKFVDLFLKSEGSFKEVQAEMNITYQKAKQTISNILVKLGLKNESEKFSMIDCTSNQSTYSTVNENDHFIVKLIKEKLNNSGGMATIQLISKGKEARICFDLNGCGLECDKIPVANQLTWDVFIAAYDIAVAQDGELYKGYARAGKLGSDKLPINSLEGYIAYAVHGKSEGDSAFSPGFIVAAILDWVGVFINERGSTLKLNEGNVFVKTYEEALKNANTFNYGINNSISIMEKLNFFKQWYYFEEIDSFAPSKFIAYKDMDMNAYEVYYKTKLSGLDAEKNLKSIFKKTEGSQLDKLLPKLENFLSKYGKSPNAATEIHIKK